jgi:hypothetical protein
VKLLAAEREGHERELLVAGSCIAVLGHETQAEWLQTRVRTCHPSNLADRRFRLKRALLNRGADANARNENELTAFHLMLKKGADFEHFAILSKQGARGDIPGPDGKTAIEIVSHKKDERFRKLARKLGGTG